MKQEYTDFLPASRARSPTQNGIYYKVDIPSEKYLPVPTALLIIPY